MPKKKKVARKRAAPKGVSKKRYEGGGGPPGHNHSNAGRALSGRGDPNSVGVNVNPYTGRADIGRGTTRPGSGGSGLHGGRSIGSAAERKKRDSAARARSEKINAKRRAHSKKRGK